jgi:hypothetical protein
VVRIKSCLFIMLQLVRFCLKMLDGPSVIQCFGFRRLLVLCNAATLRLLKSFLVLLGGLLLCLQVLSPARSRELGQELADSLLVDLVFWVLLGAQLLGKPSAGLEEDQVRHGTETGPVVKGVGLET